MAGFESMEPAFIAFCNASKSGSTVCTDKTLKKISTDCKLVCPGMDQNRIDIQFRKFLGPKDKSVDFQKFTQFVAGYLADAFVEASKKNRDDAIDLLVKKIATGKPSIDRTTAVSKDGATSRLTNVEGYTGAHKERFDKTTGKGKGKEGRESVISPNAQEGYVRNYKNMNTYDKRH